MKRLLLLALVTCTYASAILVAVPSAPAAAADDPPLKKGDVIFGAFDVGVVRLRGTERTTWCRSVNTNPGEAQYYFRRPDDLIIDAQGRVVVLNTIDDGHPGSFSLWRCDAPGSTPELLGNLGLGSLAGRFNPFPGKDVNRAAGLHLIRRKIFDGSSLRSQDLYAFGVILAGSNETQTITYDPATGAWSDRLMPPPIAGVLDMLSAKGYELSAGNGIRAVRQPISIEFQIGEFSGGLAFQTLAEIRPRIDDRLTPNVPVNCNPPPNDGIPLEEPEVPGAKHGLSEIYGFGFRDGGLITESGSIGNGWPFNHDILLDDIVNVARRDRSVLFHDDYNCSVEAALPFSGPEGFNSYNDADGIPRQVDVMSSDGTVGTQTNPGLDGRIVRVGGDPVQIIATGMGGPRGIETYPPHDPSSSGVAIIIRINSPVSVLITAPDGRRLGIDPSTGATVNEFGDEGWDSQTGEPHLYGIFGGPAGDYQIDTLGTGSGPFSVNAFGLNLATDETTKTTITGTASPGSTTSGDLSFASDGTISGGGGPPPPADDVAPVIASHGSITAEATGSAGATVTYTEPTATDDVDGAVVVSCSPVSGGVFPLGHTRVDCSASDAAGNSGHSSFDVNVVDTTPPTLTPPPSITREATGPGGTVFSFAGSATDVVDGSVPVVCSPPSGTTFAIGLTTVTCTATDVHGNAAHGSFAVTVGDTTPPSLTLPASVTVDATGPAGAVATYAASATDLVDGSVPAACSPPSGATFPAGDTTVTCSSTDVRGNVATGHFVVHVRSGRELLAMLRASVEGSSLSSAEKAKLGALLMVAQAVLPSDPNAQCPVTCFMLDLFVTTVVRDSSGPRPAINGVIAARWIADARKIQTALPCGSLVPRR